MTTKVIRGILRRKLNDWLQSIDDVELRNYVKDKIIVSGGCIASLLMNEKVNDFDIYLTEKTAAAKLARYYLSKFRNNPSPRFKNGNKFIRMWVEDKTDRVKIVIKSAGAAAEIDPGGYEYFEMSPAERAADYVEQVTAPLRADADEEASLNTTVNDMDPGMPDVDNPAFVDLIASVNEALEAPKQTGPGAKEKNKYRPVFMSTNAITLSDQIQIVVRFYGTAEEIHKHFDFVHCTNYYTSADDKLVVTDKALLSLMNRKLSYVGTLYPVCTIIRLRKFLRRGWTFDAGLALKIAHQMSELDLTDPVVLEDQLTGVDAAYFEELINILKADKAAGKTIDDTYLMNLIDRMFGD